MKSLAFVALGTLLLAGCQSETTTETVVTTTATDVDTTVDELVTEVSVEATPVAFNVDGAPTRQFSVPDMMCEFACAPAVKKVLAAQTGVKDVQIDFEHKVATVAIDEAQFSADAAIAALVDYDFGNSKLITAEEN